MRSTHSLFSRHICCYLHIVQLQKQWLGNTIQLSKAVLDCTDCVMSQRNTSPVQQIQLNLLFSVVCFLEQVRSSSEVWVQRNISKYRDALMVHELWIQSTIKCVKYSDMVVKTRSTVLWKELCKHITAILSFWPKMISEPHFGDVLQQQKNSVPR